MFQNDIIAIASIPEMYLLDDTGQHRIDPCMVTFEVDAIMESRASSYWIFPVTESRVEFQEVERQADVHTLADQIEKQGVLHIDKQWYILLDGDLQATTCLKGYVRCFCVYAIRFFLCNCLSYRSYLCVRLLSTEGVKLRYHLHTDCGSDENQ